MIGKSFFLIFLITFGTIFSQNEPKRIQASRVEIPPKIDGKLDDACWENADVAKDFVMFYPGTGDKEPLNQKTKVKVIYDDQAIYIAAYLFDNNPESVFKQFSERDSFANTDFFGVSINTNNDGQNEFEFFVTAGATQMDAQVSPSNGEDFSWNEVWFSEISFNNEGWYVEMKIPYSALRFSIDDIQTWGINFHRKIESSKEKYSWNFIDKTKGKISQYSGLLTGITNIKPPTRLSLSPFTSFIVNNYDGNTETNFVFGLDLKYGITDNFTLIATLIPDFSQTGFDNITLNLGPFEQRFAEQRQFFIEGADLLEKGNLFFSRRIGSRPVDHASVEEKLVENEIIEFNPTEVDVINAVKVTGRSKKGLGIAVLNAVTKKTEATILDTITNEKRKLVTEPISNYNVFVLDQEFNKNSSIGIVNTNVIRKGDFRDANVTALVLNLANRTNSYKIYGEGSASVIKENELNTTGFSSRLKFSKTKGNIRYFLVHKIADTKYDKNDLGFQRRNNYNNFSGNVSFRTFKPTKHFNQIRIGLWAGYFRRFDPSVYTGNYITLYGFATTKSQFTFGSEIETNFGKKKDYFEPRTEGRYWLEDPETSFNVWISSDYRKKIAIDLSLGGSAYNGNAGVGYLFSAAPRYRVNDRLQLIYTISYEQALNQLGYVDTLEDETIIFGKRKTNEIENTLSGKFNFNDKSSVTLAFRHYWSPVIYDDNYFELEEDGNLSPTNYSENNDLNFNSWNLDLRYIWQFERGSEIVALYRNSILNYDDQSNLSFHDNISNLFDQPFGQSLSIKLIYYLDYNKMKNWF